MRTAEPLPVDDYAEPAHRRLPGDRPGDGDTLAAGLVGAPLPLLDRRSEPRERDITPRPTSLARERP